VLVVLVVVALVVHAGPFGTGHKTEAGASIPPATAVARTETSPATGPSADSSSSTGAHRSGGHAPAKDAGKAKASTSPSSKPSPSKSPAKPKHGSEALVAFGPSLIVDGNFSQTTLQPWNYVVQNAVIEPGDGVDKQNAIQLTSTPQAAIGQTITGLTPGVSYEVTGWAYSTGSKIGIGVMDTVDNTINDHELTTATSWTELSAVFTVPANQDSATIYCIMAWGGTGYCSDLTFRAMHHT
jgi:hypothetical protein